MRKVYNTVCAFESKIERASTTHLMLLDFNTLRSHLLLKGIDTGLIRSKVQKSNLLVVAKRSKTSNDTFGNVACPVYHYQLHFTLLIIQK